MSKPLRLGLSGSAFAYVMPSEVGLAMYNTSQKGAVCKLDEHGNRLMVEFMRDMMRVMNTMDISAMECYHSLVWESEPVIEVMLENPNVEFWSVHAPYGGRFDPSSPNDEYREGAVYAYCHAVDVAKKIGAKVIVAHPGANVEYDVSKQDRLLIAADTLKRIADYAGENGVRVAIEPLPKQEPGNSLDEVLWMLEKIDRPNAGVNFDVNHLFPPEDIPGLIRKAGEKIISVHVSDQDGQERHWLPFEGTLDWQAVLGALVDVNYTGPLVYETHLKQAKSCEDVGRIVTENYKRLIALTPRN